jgi:serine/threonine-protein kinase
VARAIHRAGILHRDIKPSNIGYSSEGSPKLLDFGVARLIGRPPDAESSQGLDRLIARITGEFRSTTAYTLTATPEGQLVGTPLYMSPEAVQSEPPDASVDLWAICMVMYETIAGQHPLKESSLARTFRRIAECDIPDIREYLPSADTTLARFFHRAFASDASLRPADAEELGAELRSLRIA